MSLSHGNMIAKNKDWDLNLGPKSPRRSEILNQLIISYLVRAIKPVCLIV